MTKTSKVSPQARSWRDIPQQVNSRAMSRGGRRRMWGTTLKVTAMVATVAFLLGGVYVFTELFQDDPGKITGAVNAVPVKEIALQTDGVLAQDWIKRTLVLPPKVTLMELDLLQLRDRLLADPQVSNATVSRKFPSTLEVRISERSPVALINAQIGDGDPQPLLVARDGVVYRGTGYDSSLLKSLPFLDGIRLVRTGRGFRPIAGMNEVADLLAQARNEAPQLYREWQVVSLARMEVDGEIEVRATNVERIIFATRTQDNFLRQLAQLDVLIDTVRAKTDQPIREINLAVGRMSDGRMQVPVTFTGDLSPEAVPATREPASTPFYKPSRKSPREL